MSDLAQYRITIAMVDTAIAEGAPGRKRSWGTTLFAPDDERAITGGYQVGLAINEASRHRFKLAQDNAVTVQRLTTSLLDTPAAVQS